MIAGQPASSIPVCGCSKENQKPLPCAGLTRHATSTEPPRSFGGNISERSLDWCRHRCRPLGCSSSCRCRSGKAMTCAGRLVHCTRSDHNDSCQNVALRRPFFICSCLSLWLMVGGQLHACVSSLCRYPCCQTTELSVWFNGAQPCLCR